MIGSVNNSLYMITTTSYMFTITSHVWKCKVHCSFRYPGIKELNGKRGNNYLIAIEKGRRVKKYF